MSDEELDLSVIVVSYETRELTLACLQSIFSATRDVRFEVIVADNASTDGSAAAVRARFPQVRLLSWEENLGFAGANNRAASEARGRYLVLLNPDTVVLDGALTHLFRFMDGHPDAGACGGRTLFADGTLNPTSCWRRPTPWSVFCKATGLRALLPGSRVFDPQAMGGWKRDTRSTVDVITGCLMIIPRWLWEELGGFDVRFFMYAEDTDLSRRIASTGRSLWIIPEATIVHHGGASETVRADKIIRLFTADAQFYRKHWKPWAARFGVFMLDVWASTRLVAYGALSLARARYRPARATWRDIWRARRAWHRDPAPRPVAHAVRPQAAGAGAVPGGHSAVAPEAGRSAP